MNYRHAFHAGNFADVLKHAVLARILVHLARKEAAFRVIDTHAGAGLYDLAGPEAERTGEWRGGIERLAAAKVGGEAGGLLAPFLGVLAAVRAEHGASAYPGSPEIARRLMRAQDRLVAVEAEPAAFAGLKRTLAGDPRAKAVRLDGWVALNAYIPPRERRGLVLIDPPYEAAGEFEAVAAHLVTAVKKWPTGLYAVWYPIADAALVERFAARLRQGALPPALRLELAVRRVRPRAAGLAGCGMVLVNPPFTLEAELGVLLPALTEVLAAPGEGDWRLERLAAEAPTGSRL